MSNIYIKLDFSKHPNIQYSYSIDSKECSSSILFKLDTIKYREDGELESIVVHHEPHPSLLSEYKKKLFEFVCGFLDKRIIKEINESKAHMKEYVIKYKPE